jgi:hypothetical protein
MMNLTTTDMSVNVVLLLYFAISSSLNVFICIKMRSFLSFFSLLLVSSEFSAQKKVSSQRFMVPLWWTKKESGENPELYLQL